MPLFGKHFSKKSSDEQPLAGSRSSNLVTDEQLEILFKRKLQVEIAEGKKFDLKTEAQNNCDLHHLNADQLKKLKNLLEAYEKKRVAGASKAAGVDKEAAVVDKSKRTLAASPEMEEELEQKNRIRLVKN